MVNKKEITVAIREEAVKEIESLVMYKEYKDIVFKHEEKIQSVETFIEGCVYHYLEIIKDQARLSGLEELQKPFTLKNNVKQLMEEKGYAQSDLVRMTGIKAASINQIVHNKSQPSLDYFLRIWIVLGCPPLKKILYRENT